MFTGIIKDVGRVAAITESGGGARFVFQTSLLRQYPAHPGDSIAVNGVCLTAVECDADGFSADVSPETLRLTNLGSLEEGAAINLEPALRANDPLGGHIVTGHVDGTAEVTACRRSETFVAVEFELDAGGDTDLSKYIARKGSVAVDGVSLTVNGVAGRRFDVMLIPHTLEMTNFDGLAPGQRVNIEVDLMARYAERMLNA